MGPETVLTNVLFHWMLNRREAMLNELREMEDILMGYGQIKRRGVISGRQMKDLEKRFGAAAIAAVLTGIEAPTE